MDCYWCFSCGRSDRGIELHHIYGRISASPLNCSPQCTYCHSHMNHNQDEQRTLLMKTIKYLTGIDYKFKPADYDFLLSQHRDFEWVKENIR